MKLNKFILGLVVGLSLFLLVAFSYTPEGGACDVRLGTVDEHDYVVATIVRTASTGGCGVGIIHHLGCRKCSEKGDVK